MNRWRGGGVGGWMGDGWLDKLMNGLVGRQVER